MKPIILQGHIRPIRDIKFNKDGDLLFTGSNDRFVTLWASETGERIGTYQHSAAVINIAVTQDSKILITGDATGGCYFWDLNSGNLLRKLEKDATMSVKYLDLSFGDQKLCFAYGGRTKESISAIDIFNIKDIFSAKADNTTKVINDLVPIYTVTSEKSKFSNCKWINLNRNIVCGKEDGSIQLIDYQSGAILKENQIHKLNIMDIDVSKCEEIILTASKDGKSCVIDPDTFEVIHTLFPQNPTRNLNSCKISPLFSANDENSERFHSIVAGGQESRDVTTTHAKKGGFEVIFHNLMYGEEIGAVQGHFGPVNTLAFSPCGKVFASGAEDATIRLHKLEDDYLTLENDK